MVRLKDYDEAQDKVIKQRFQFLMVRLKGLLLMFAEWLLVAFQFLMVRLKGSLSNCTWLVRSLFQFLMVRLKGCLLHSMQFPHPIFQFLMVRLKACILCLTVSLCNYISIPYGSIKRTVVFRQRTCVFVISIPYGSIKRTPPPPTMIPPINFNSLWFD